LKFLKLFSPLAGIKYALDAIDYIANKCKTAHQVCGVFRYAHTMLFRLKHPIRTFLTGLLALLPLAATLLLLTWVLQFLSKYLGPGSGVGQLLTSVGLGVTESELLGYVLGVLLVIVIVYAIGLLTEAGLQRGLARLINGIVLKIPVVRTIYDVAQKLVGLFARKEGDELQSMTPVWLHFGGKKPHPASPGSPEQSGDAKGGTAVLGFLSTPHPVMINGQTYLAVLVPTAPVPVGGGLLYVPPDWVEPADIGMEAVTSIYVSMGVTSDQYLKVKPSIVAMKQ
jgi:uncharacterized membrane protein